MYKNQKGNFMPILGIIVLLVVTATISYYFGTQKSTLTSIDKSLTNNQTTQQITTNEYPFGTTYSILSGCNGNSCLFESPSENGVVEGFAKLQGYYNQYKSEDFGKEVICDSILVTGGNDQLINSLKNQIIEGNTVNKIDENNNLLVNIRTDDLDPKIKLLVESSNIDHEIELGVIRITPVPRGASTCSNFVEIISAKLIMD